MTEPTPAELIVELAAFLDTRYASLDTPYADGCSWRGAILACRDRICARIADKLREEAGQ